MFLLCISDVIITSKKEATYLLITRNRLQTNDKNHDYKKSKVQLVVIIRQFFKNQIPYDDSNKLI